MNREVGTMTKEKYFQLPEEKNKLLRTKIIQSIDSGWEDFYHEVDMFRLRGNDFDIQNKIKKE